MSQKRDMGHPAELGIKRIDIDYKEKIRKDENGNIFRYRSLIVDTEAGRDARWTWDVYLQTTP